jgi:4-amino-4-deoxy-L-arabinose transferase-like glycosyltransferase
MTETPQPAVAPRAWRRSFLSRISLGNRRLGRGASVGYASGRRVPKPLALLLIVAGLQAVAWNISVPAFQGPDEASHFAYLQYLAENGRMPSVTLGGASTEESEALRWLNLRPLEGNDAGRPAWTSADLRAFQEIEKHEAKGSRANGVGENALGKNPPLYYAAMAIPYRVFLWLPLLKRLFVLRILNSLCFLATIALTWMIAGEVFGRARWKQTLATAVVALEPQLAYTSAVMNADNLLITLTTAFLLAALRLVKYGPSTKRVLGASAIAAAAVLTHGRGLVTLPVLAVALLVSWIVFRPAARDSIKRAAIAVATVGAAFLAYLLLGRASGGRSLYGGQVGELQGSAGFSLRQFLSSIYQFYFPRLAGEQARIGPAYGYRQVFIETFYGTFGSLEVHFKPRAYDLLQVLSAVGLVGFYTAILKRFNRIRERWPTVVVLLTLLLTTLFFLHYVSYRALLGNGGSDPVIVGRYLLPMVSLFGLAIAFTVGALPRRLGPFAGALVLGIAVLFALTGIGITMTRFYA